MEDYALRLFRYSIARTNMPGFEVLGHLGKSPLGLKQKLSAVVFSVLDTDTINECAENNDGLQV